MKNILLGIIIGLTFMFSSCSILGQSYTSTYRVYYDYVITGIVNEPGFVNDGYYSYHIIGEIPMNVYWELYPCGSNVALYNRSMVFQRWYYPNNWWVFYNGHRHHTYIPHHHPPKPNGNMRPPQNPPPKPNGVRPSQNHRQPTNNGNVRPPQNQQQKPNVTKPSQNHRQPPTRNNGGGNKGKHR